jgi:4-amino-4-deoxy-L-arabinose transferase-like glycosyltransferase
MWLLVTPRAKMGGIRMAEPRSTSRPSHAVGVAPVAGAASVGPRADGAISRGEWSALLVLVALAVGLRMAYVLALREHPAFEAPMMDAGYHWAWARAIADGREFQDGPFFRAPLYPVWLGGLVALFGEASTLAPRLVQALLGGGTVVLTWLLGRRVGAVAGGRASASVVGLGAAVIVATYWALVVSEGELLLEVLYLPLMLGGLVLAARAIDASEVSRSQALRCAALAGLVFGLAAITRPNVLLCMPLPFVLLLRSRGWRPALALTLGTLAPIAPVTLHNALEGDAALIATQAGVNLWIGNNPTSDGATAIVPGTRGGWWEGYYDSIAAAEAAEGHTLLPSEVSAHYTSRAFAFARAEPLQALRLLARKTWLFVHSAEVGNNSDPRFAAVRYAPWVVWLPVRFGWLCAFGVVGLAVAARQGATGRLLTGFVTLHALSVVLFFVNTRFRLPVVPGLAIGAAFLVEHVRLVWLEQRRGTSAPGRNTSNTEQRAEYARAKRLELGGTALAVAGLLLAAYWPLLGLRDGRATGLMDLAKAELARGNAPAAVGFLEEALEHEPNEVFARVALATALQQTGEVLRAVRLMEETRRLPEGARPEVLAQLVDALIDAGRASDAECLAHEDLARDPRQPSLRYGLARALGARGDAEGAREALREVLVVDPSAAHAAFALGELEMALRNPAAARDAFMRVIALEGRGPDVLVAAARQRLAALGK